MRPLRKLAFLLDEFGPSTAAQQLLDRFLFGYPRDGAFHTPKIPQVTAYLVVSAEANFGERPSEFDLVVAATAEAAVAEADAVVVVSRRPGAMANEALLRIALEQIPAGGACFVHGVLANSLTQARKAIALAASRRIALLAGTPLCVTWRLPPMEVPSGTRLSEALIVVQVNPQSIQATPPSPPATLGGAELQALEGLLPILEQRAGGEAGVRSVRFLEDQAVWRAGDKGLWSWSLLAAALSRSHSPQGDAVLDSRTQDLVGGGLVPKLARHPRAWLMEHGDGLRTTVLVLDGVVADFNVAVRGPGGVMSAQLFRAPPPAEHHFSGLAAAMEDFLRDARTPWPVERNLLIAGLLEIFRQPSSLSGRWVETAGLVIGER